MKPLSPTFTIGSIRIGAIEGASCVNFGNNFPIDFTSYKKQNQGFGSISGDDNDISDILSRLDEKDVIEAFQQSHSDTYPDWMEKILEAQELNLEDEETVQEDLLETD